MALHPGNKQRALRILAIVMEDEPPMMLLRSAAAGASAEIRRAATVLEGLETLDGFEADIVLADLMILDPRTGFDFMYTLRALNHRPLPVGIAVGDGSAGLDARRALASNYHAFMCKPLTSQGMLIAFETASRLSTKRSRLRVRNNPKTDLP